MYSKLSKDIHFFFLHTEMVDLLNSVILYSMKKIGLLGYWTNFLYCREWIFLTVAARREL